MTRTLVKHALSASGPAADILVQGWVRTRRDSKGFSFVELNDGTSLKSLQVIVDANLPGYESIKEAVTGASFEARGELVASPGAGQKWEVRAREFKVVGLADDSYPLQKKGHSPEFLRSIAHLRARTNLFGSIYRVRSRLAMAVHEFFQNRDYVYVHTPIITASDCEGAGEMFRVTTLDLEKPSPGRKSEDFAEDFFGRSAYLTVSGQLQGETAACALSNIYTFGPTFRAENSNTSRHAAEFWMIEPETAFLNLEGNMDLAEALVKHLAKDIVTRCPDEVELFNKFVDKELRARLDFLIERPFVRCTYTDAIEILNQSGKTFENAVAWGDNLQSEHERYLAETHFKSPVTVYNYPKELKPFYMRLNEDGKTVTAMDVLVPGIGEIIGGSQREERLDVLLDNMRRHHLKEEDYSWYLDTRRFGSVPHAGFGMGFERMLMFVTGVSNIRDVVPFPRTPGHADF